ncbi:MAG: hypothetical protein NTY98_23585, partial [Verrucomicrobia bacterium]|nr:hypothetical protein [Verrucomicrobiota bacterium]
MLALPSLLASCDILRENKLLITTHVQTDQLEHQSELMPVTIAGEQMIFKKVPEVAQFFGKAGRAETATDPAPLEMFETVINLKPEEQWRPGMTVEKLKNE